MRASIAIEICPGIEILEACTDACRVATLLGISADVWRYAHATAPTYGEDREG